MAKSTPASELPLNFISGCATPDKVKSDNTAAEPDVITFFQFGIISFPFSYGW